MAGQFKYVRRRDTFAWENDSIRVEYSEPWLDYVSDVYEKRYNFNMLFTYRYTLKVWEKRKYDDRYRWKPLFEVRTGVEFEEAIIWLVEHIKFFLENPKPDSRWEKHWIDKDSWEYQLTKEIKGYSDEYVITKKVREKSTAYDVYVGRDVQGRESYNSHSLGIWLSDLCLNDLKQLKVCLEAFMKYSLEKHNRDLRKEIEVSCASHKYVNGKVYEYCVLPGENTVNYDAIEAIYTVGDRISSGDMIHFEEEHFYAESFAGRTIMEITEKEMVLDGGERIPIGRIVYMYLQPTKEMLSYDKKQITEEFLGILNESEREDFAKLSVEELFAKYGEVIINRTWMFRDEHGFVTIEDENRHERIHEIVREIIHDIKGRV